MGTIERWLTGITVLAVIATVVTNRNSPQIIDSLTGGIAGIYKSAQGR